MKIHKAISILLSAPAMAVYVTLVFSLFSPIRSNLADLVTSVVLGIVFLSLIPIVALYSESKSFSGWDLYDRKRRNRPYMVTIISYVVISLIFWYLGNHVMFLISLSYLAVTSAMFFINLFWKISIHSAGIAGPVTALFYVFGPVMGALYLLLIPVAYSRWKLGSHDFYQLLGGALIAIFITYVIYFILW